jgi:glycerophosphoryl diester phosphodiesterase
MAPIVPQRVVIIDCDHSIFGYWLPALSFRDSQLTMRFPLFFAALLMLSSSASTAPFLVAHRGASKEAPENTLPAFKLAWSQEADAIEGDFHLTRDGHIVCFHDRDTKKITGKKLVVAESTLADLQALDVGKLRGPSFAGTRMPILREVLATVPAGKKIYIEIKCGPEITPTLLAEVKQSKLRDDQVVIIAFDFAVIAAVKMAHPQWTANWLYSFESKLKNAAANDLPELLRKLKLIKADGLSTNSHPSLTKKDIETLRSAGYQHHVWTIDDAKTARRFLEMGSQTVTTNKPGALRKALAP